MDKGDIDNYAYFQEVWTSPKRYALVKNEFRDGYAIVDVINKLFVLIEDSTAGKANRPFHKYDGASTERKGSPGRNVSIRHEIFVIYSKIQYGG